MAETKNARELPFWERGGSIVEYGLIIGFSIILFLAIIDMIFRIFGWSGIQIQDLLNFQF